MRLNRSRSVTPQKSTKLISISNRTVVSEILALAACGAHLSRPDLQKPHNLHHHDVRMHLSVDWRVRLAFRINTILLFLEEFHLMCRETFERWAPCSFDHATKISSPLLIITALDLSLPISHSSHIYCLNRQSMCQPY